MVATETPARPLRLRGVIEGYYGRPWTGDARRDVIRFLGARKLDTFVYGPKNDPFHRTRWRDPYPDDALADLRATARVARRARVAFVFALSPVLDVCYSCPADFQALAAKLRQVARAGVHRFALLFDDGGSLTDPADVARYGASTDGTALARAQGDLVTRTRRWLRRHGRTLDLVVPSEYAGTSCTAYHGALAAALPTRLPVGWTGPGIFAETIAADEARARAACIPGHPVVLWDNYPVNDTVLSANLHLGPLTGREAGLLRALGGYLLNPMTEAHGSLVALGTAAAYLRDPDRYDAERVWGDVLAELGSGGEGLAVLAAQVRSSVLDLRDARALAQVVDDVAASHDGPDWSVAVDALALEETRQAAAPADIAARLGTTPLATEIAPWVDELAAHTARGLDAVRLLQSLKPSLADVQASLDSGTLHVSGRAVPPDGTTAGTVGPDLAAEAVRTAARIANPPLASFLACLGDILGADIHFCPAFGLNVHGKVLYARLTGTGAALVSDRNVHDRLVMLAGGAYAAWAMRHDGVDDGLAVTLDGIPLTLAADGRFAASLAVSGARARLLVTTAAGDATARDVP